MQGVSKRLVRLAAVSVVVVALAHPAFAAAQTPDRGNTVGSLLHRIIVRVLDTIQIGLPPG
jgi:hypothetical protein